MPLATQNVVVRLVLGGLAVATFTAASVGLYMRGTAAPEPHKVEPQKLFTKWPDAPRKPELVMVLTGQMHGYLQKCGCSNPQKGGLERRYNFIQSLKARGWEVVGLDVGDLPRPLPYTPTPDQTLTKYEFGMKALQLMDYKAIALGREEMAMPTLNALAKYSLQKGNEYPRVLAANVTNKMGQFPGANGASMIGDDEVITARSGLKVGVIGLVGGEVVQKNVDKSVGFGPPAAAVNGVLAGWKKNGTDVRVMLYQGPLDWKDAAGKQIDAKSAADAFKDFHIILCKTPDDSDAPLEPTKVNAGATMICQVGQRGQTVGVIGIYRGEGGIELYYERVVMSDEFETPPDREKGNAMLQLLQDYSDTVKDNDFLSEMAKRKRQHASQVLGKGSEYAGDSQCVDCHKAESAVYAKTKHANAYDALAKLAKHPTGRNFDGECIICHTVGYEYQSGYVNEKQTAHLKNVQCESCHGPASLHVAEEHANLKKRPNQQAHTTLPLLSPWKMDGKGMMPSLDKLEAYAKESDQSRKEAMLTKSEYETFLRVYQTCARCHDIDNDPHFKLEEYWKKIAHTGMGKKK